MQRYLTLDIGGEGRHRRAWNLNPSPLKTLGSERGSPIPRRIAGRAEAIPLPDACVGRVIVERTPLHAAALREIARVIAPRGVIVLRHAAMPGFDPHTLALRMLPGQIRRRLLKLTGRTVQQTVFSLAAAGDGEFLVGAAHAYRRYDHRQRARL